MTISRRQFITHAIAGATALRVASQSTLAVAQQGYQLIDPPQNTNSRDSVEVVEYFWLGCPHCYSFEPTIEAWKANMPENVTFIREAPPLNSAWSEHSRSFYAAQLMGQEQPFVEAMFKAIHEDRKRMRRPDEIADLAGTLGLDRDRFLKTMDSFGVKTRINRSIQLAKGSGISGVPAIVINGKYRTGARQAGGNAGMINVINRTIAIEKQAMGLD